MKSIKAAVSGGLALAIVSGGLVFGAGAASATTPAFEPDPNASNGSITFYDAQGHVITGGTDLAHLYDYAVGSTAVTRTTTKAQTTFGFPDHTKSDSTLWFQAQASAATTFPNTTAPAPINGLASNIPVATVGASEANLSAILGTTTMDNTAGYANIVQIRLKDSGAGIGNGVLASPFWATDIQIDQAAGTWQVVYPAVAANTTTTLDASPTTSAQGDPVTLTAHVNAQALNPTGAAGTVQFMDGANPIGSAVNVVNGVAQTTTSSLAQGSHNLSAVFTPTDSSAYAGSTGTATETVTAPAIATTTTLTVSGGYAVQDSGATLSASVTDPSSTPVTAGSVAFYLDGSNTAIPGTVDDSTTPGTWTLTVAASAGNFAVGQHTIVAKFTPTDSTVFKASQDSKSFTTNQAGACSQSDSQCIDTGNIKATVPPGTLVISTPYGPGNPFDMGTLTLDTAANLLKTPAESFGPITVTDQRSGNLPWQVTAKASDLTDGGGNANGNSTIDAQNLGLTGVVLNSSNATGTFAADPDNTAALGVQPGTDGTAGLGGNVNHNVAHIDQGFGTTVFHGLLTLTAPTNTEAGVFTGTITFTVG